MHLLLQVLGGGFYLLNKIFFSRSERARFAGDEAARRRWRIRSWAVYLVGLPPWVIIFVGERNWIAASVEASGAPAMLLGLVTAVLGKQKDVPPWLNRLARVCIAAGFAVSLWDLGGFGTFTQWLETALVAGFLVGTYLLAKERAAGYLWYVLMHVSCAWLMWIERYPMLFGMQILSLGFILDAFLVERRAKRRNQPDPP